MVAKVEIVHLWSCSEILKGYSTQGRGWDANLSRCQHASATSAVLNATAGLGDGAVAEVEIVQLWSCSEILRGDSVRNPRKIGPGAQIPVA